MAEPYEVTESQLEGEHDLGGNTFNLFKVNLRAQNGVTYEGVEFWRPKDKDPIWAGEVIVGKIEEVGRDRKKFKPDWRATNQFRREGGGGSSQQGSLSASGVRVSANTERSPAQTAHESEARRQASIEKQTAQKLAMEYARLMHEATGEVPSISQIKSWANEILS